MRYNVIRYSALSNRIAALSIVGVAEMSSICLFHILACVLVVLLWVEYPSFSLFFCIVVSKQKFSYFAQNSDYALCSVLSESRHSPAVGIAVPV